jgi:SAM-dependent methyltransferase
LTTETSHQRDLRRQQRRLFDAVADLYDLVVSATALHWIDPDVGWAEAARLLRPGGWLAVLGTKEVYDEPVGPGSTSRWPGCARPERVRTGGPPA